ncbi:LysR family transcriptional regulator [Pantoea dispersa]|uniref:LysR family transcriptional regulator n=1 Tax=Pantoea dispersa TaxID=59814 RepID=UPI000735FD82|nr:LysR family transcriptional regulator [Pantoea dispersa]KTS17802.1 LysR family transcriptional regulator [Pantoea dispersa]KTS89445.1 LysR family transcriptional regulator [Pantoea dispersa]
MNRTGLTELEIVLAVARRGTFKAAASELEMSPSAVTNAVAALEKRLGVRLFNRTTRSVALTDAGRRFSEKIVPALAMIRSAAEEAGSDPGDPAGMLRLNVPPESSALWYASILLPFLQRYPRIRVDIYSQKERVDIVADGYDAGIRLAEDVPGDMIAVRLTPEMRMIVVAAPAYLAHAGTPQTPEALDQHQTLCMRMADGSVYRWELSQQQQRYRLQGEPRMAASDMSAIHQAALAGLGIACMTEQQVAADVQAGRLVHLLPGWQVPLGALCLYYPGHRLVPPALRALTDFVRAQRDASALPEAG